MIATFAGIVFLSKGATMGMDWKSAIKALKAFHAPGLDGSPASMQKELEGLEESLKGWEDRDESRGKSFEAWKAVDAKLRAERDAALLQNRAWEEAVNAFCSCGGRGPRDGACTACMVSHQAKGYIEKRIEGGQNA